jgi:hypothetical protein
LVLAVSKIRVLLRVLEFHQLWNESNRLIQYARQVRYICTKMRKQVYSEQRTGGEERDEKEKGDTGGERRAQESDKDRTIFSEGKLSRIYCEMSFCEAYCFKACDKC